MSAAAPPPRRLLGLLTDNVALEAQLSIFESVAGRSAMMGFVTAATIELFTQQALFPTVSGMDESVGIAAFGGSLAVASLLGYLSKETVVSAGLRDAVLSSMTAVQRSAASMAAFTNLDELLDSIVQRTFDQEWARSASTPSVDEDEVVEK